MAEVDIKELARLEAERRKKEPLSQEEQEETLGWQKHREMQKRQRAVTPS